MSLPGGFMKSYVRPAQILKYPATQLLLGMIYWSGASAICCSVYAGQERYGCDGLAARTALAEAAGLGWGIEGFKVTVTSLSQLPSGLSQQVSDNTWRRRGRHQQSWRPSAPRGSWMRRSRRERRDRCILIGTDDVNIVCFILFVKLNIQQSPMKSENLHR